LLHGAVEDTIEDHPFYPIDPAPLRLPSET
jgi:hypothetical protein